MSYQHLIWLYRYVWIAPHALLLAVAAVMFRKKLHKQYPIFFSYLLFDCLQFCVVFTLSQLRVSPAVYADVDLLGRTGDAALSLGVIQELFAVGLVRVEPMRNQVARLLRWITISLVMLASLLVAAVCYSCVNPGSFRSYWSIEALDVTQCVLLFLVFLWHRFLGVRMPPASFGIAVGMGLAAAADLPTMMFRTYLVAQNGLTLDMLNMAAYHGAVLLWLYFVQVRESAPFDARGSLPQLQKQSAELGRIARL